MIKIERYIPCPDCQGTGKTWEELDQDYNPIYNEISETCDNCDGQGSIENEAYWRAILPKPIPFKEGREAQLEYYNQKNNG